MTTIYMKIYSYDVASQSLEVGFASTETSSQNPDDYDRYSFNVDHYNDVTSKEDLIRRLLQSGASMCSQIVQQENIRSLKRNRSRFLHRLLVAQFEPCEWFPVRPHTGVQTLREALC